jgi:hypothetical protein
VPTARLSVIFPGAGGPEAILGGAHGRRDRHRADRDQLAGMADRRVAFAAGDRLDGVVPAGPDQNLERLDARLNRRLRQGEDQS